MKKTFQFLLSFGREAGKTIAAFLFAVVVIGAVSAFQEPTVAPPSGTVYAPVNIGSAAQTKSGSLSVLGNLGVGAQSPTAKLQVGSGTSIWGGGPHLDLVGSRPGDGSPLTTLSFSPSSTKGWHQNADTAGSMNFHAFKGGTWPIVLSLKENSTVAIPGNVGISMGLTNPGAPLEVRGGWPATVLISNQGNNDSPTLRVAGPGSTYKYIELKDTGNGEVWQFSHRPQSEQNRLDIWAFKENSGSLTDVRRLVSMDRNWGVGIGYLPNDIPSGWGGGLVTWDIVAKASVRAHALCLGGSMGGNDLGECRSSWGGGGGFGGMYRSGWSWNFRKEEWDYPYCVYTNPFTGGCSCPSGFSASLFNRQVWARDTKEEAYYCYKI